MKNMDFTTLALNGKFHNWEIKNVKDETFRTNKKTNELKPTIGSTEGPIKYKANKAIPISVIRTAKTTANRILNFEPIFKAFINFLLPYSTALS